jgi:predicted tellurium resistance membrane protein TerC
MLSLLALQRQVYHQISEGAPSSSALLRRPNVLALAGAAREHPTVLAFGLLLSIALMGLAANLIARLLQKYRWIAYVGLAIVLYVACEMIYRGTLEVIGAVHLQ